MKFWSDGIGLERCEVWLGWGRSGEDKAGMDLEIELPRYYSSSS